MTLCNRATIRFNDPIQCKLPQITNDPNLMPNKTKTKQQSLDLLCVDELAPLQVFSPIE
jgi:homoserine trans-succinylase